MKISAQLAWEFNRRSVAAGNQLYEFTEVEMDSADKGAITARFGYSRVKLRLKGMVLEAGCNCQTFSLSRQCEHVWATMLAAEEEGLISAPAEGRVFFAKDERAASTSVTPAWVKPKPAPKAPPRPRKLWLNRTNELVRAAAEPRQTNINWPENRIIFYDIRVVNNNDSDVHLSVSFADPKRNRPNELTKPKPFNLALRQFDAIANEVDRSILKNLAGAREGNSYYSSMYNTCSIWLLHPALARELLPRICATGRCFLDSSDDTKQTPIQWRNEPWNFGLSLKHDRDQYIVTGMFTRGAEQKYVSDPVLIVGGSILFTFDEAAPIESAVPVEWINNFRANGPIVAPDDEWEDLATTLMQANLPADALPPELRAEEIRIAPVPCLRVETAKNYYGEAQDVGSVSFDYGGTSVRRDDARGAILQKDRKLLVRDRNAEHLACERLDSFKLPRTIVYTSNTTGWVITPKKLGAVVSQLSKEGWRIDFQGKKVVQPTETSLDVTSGIDWFDLKATITFGKHKYTYPQLLKALEAGGSTLVLPNGDIAVLPDEWMAEIARLTALGKREGDAFRFKANQAGVLDVLLADRPEVKFDEKFIKARDRLKAFDGIRTVNQPESFKGQLRGYQCEGMGWMEFLREFGFGGCLADDMGVGKTAQVLAALEARRVERERERGALVPSIAVVPRSLVFNWQQEAARFTPNLRILDHTTPDRSIDRIPEHDLVLVTYGTLRRDIAKLREIRFDYAILDEAQAIKNAASDSAKAARLLEANHRLALSGTPVQNSLNDLWSLFQFLNPGMLGASGALKTVAGSSTNPDEKTRTLLARALRPLILRRTKEQVASELPSKVESILNCEMEGEQRKLYDELRNHYRGALLGAIETQGMNKAKIMILEALLRLRQAACHPGLIDKKRTSEPSAKLDTLLARLSEVIQEGHKALVFSQFTSFLDIVRKRLDKDGVPYEYLDGATTDRQARVQHFESDKNCKLFLISLKAGGVGLNLVAADYVFLLDPWWNPAVEAQAIDRTHRIGQTRHVFAYRLIAKDTVEEKVLALQERKRHLADAVINQDNSLLAAMGREELEYLLS